MDQFFAKDYTGDPFGLFALPHLLAIIAIILLNVWVIRLRNRPAAQRHFRILTAIILIANEASWHLWHLFTNQWSVKTMLPLHVCSVLVFLSALMLVTSNQRLRSGIYEFAYFMGIAGASQAILTPDLGIYGYPHYRFFQTFISHGLIVTAAIYLTTVEGYRPTWASLRRVMVWMNVYLLFVGIVNALVGSNYMFIAHKPETPSLIDVLGPWPWYILSLEAIGLALFLLLYLPFALRDQFSGKKPLVESAAD